MLSPFERQKIEVHIFWDSQPFRFWYVEVHHQRRLKSTRTGISFQFKTLAHPETENLVYFLWGKVYIRKFCNMRATGFWFKNWYFPLSACCSYQCHIYYGVVAGMWHLRHQLDHQLKKLAWVYWWNYKQCNS